MGIGKTIMLARDHNDTSSADLDQNGSSSGTRLPSPQRGRGAGSEGESGGGSQFQGSLSDRDLGSPSAENAHCVCCPLTPNPSPALGRGGPKFVGSFRPTYSLRLCVSAVAFALLLTAVGQAARPK